HQREYEKLGFEVPASWSATAVESLLTDLEERGVDAREAASRQRTRRELEEASLQIAEEERAIETERERIAGALGVAPLTTGPVELAWVSETLVRWQAAHADWVAEAAALQTAEEDAARLADDLRARLAPLGYGTLTTTGEIKSATDALRQRRQALQTARTAVRSAEATLARIDDDRDQQKQEIQRIFDSLGLQSDSDEVVRLWC